MCHSNRGIDCEGSEIEGNQGGKDTIEAEFGYSGLFTNAEKRLEVV